MKTRIITLSLLFAAALFFVKPQADADSKHLAKDGTMQLAGERDLRAYKLEDYKVPGHYDRNKDGRYDLIAIDKNGDGIADYWTVDRDFDGVFNDYIYDRNFDGKPDQWEYDLDLDGIPENIYSDSNYDGLADLRAILNKTGDTYTWFGEFSKENGI